jgi:hypothetical protein
LEGPWHHTKHSKREGQALASQDVEVVPANSDDVEPQIEAFHVRQHNSLPTSFKLILLAKGLYAIYTVTNFWEYLFAAGPEEALKIHYH